MTDNQNTPPVTKLNVDLREAAYQALGSLKALGAEKGHASEALRAALSSNPAPQNHLVGSEGTAIQALKKIEAAAFGGYLTPDLCAEIVTSALASETSERHLEGWTKVPDELPHQFLRSINVNNQVLAYENGRYFNAWFEFEPSEGGWFWTDEADSEPNGERVKTKVRSILAIQSLRELNEDPRAVLAWQDLIGNFKAWLRGPV